MKKILLLFATFALLLSIIVSIPSVSTFAVYLSTIIGILLVFLLLSSPVHASTNDEEGLRSIIYEIDSILGLHFFHIYHISCLSFVPLLFSVALLIIPWPSPLVYSEVRQLTP
jgi:hypothetical protein